MTHHAVLLTRNNPLTCILTEYTAVPVSDQMRQAQFGIDNVRSLISVAHRRPEGSSSERILLVATEFITEEAQQALLKIIEEPPVSTRFVFIIPIGYSLLPTLESRFERAEPEDELSVSETFTDFKQALVADRLALIDEAVKRKDHTWQADLKKGLLAHLRDTSTRYPIAILKELEYVSRLLLTRGASNKFLLEHLALTLPA